MPFSVSPDIHPLRLFSVLKKFGSAVEASIFLWYLLSLQGTGYVKTKRNHVEKDVYSKYI